MQNCIALNVPLGYRVVDKIKSVSLWEAEPILMSKKQKYYTKAVRKSDKVDLVETLFVCPHCTMEFSAANSCTLPYSARVPGGKIREWSSPQMSLFDDDAIARSISLSKPIVKPELFKCPKCELTSTFSSAERSVTIRRKKKKIMITTPLLGLGELFGLQWLDCGSISPKAPMSETLIFDLGRGRVYIRLTGDSQEVICARDITGQPELIEGDFLEKLISCNKIVNRTLKRMFSSVWKQPLPFKSKEMNIRNFFRMTEFVNYGREFYSYIPCAMCSVEVDKSFRAVAHHIHDYLKLEGVYEASSLPAAKSARRLFFGVPGLFFYIAEAEKLWDTVGDINIFCKMLSSAASFYILSDLHMRPGIMPYIRDYCAIRGARIFCSRASEGWLSMLNEAIDYVTMSDGAKKEVQKGWFKRNRHNEPDVVYYSTPMHRPPDEIPDCTINGYDFIWLRNSSDYFTASLKLDNCLGSWKKWEAPVVCVRQKREYIAAIEVRERSIFQVRGYRNADIYADSKAGIAIEKWRRLHKLEICPDCMDDYLRD